jgi:CIC family chloride channel protein
MKSATLLAFVRRLFHIRRVGPSFENPRYLLKWLMISTLIGLVAGIGALVFFEAIRLATDLFLGKLVGYLPPDPLGEGSMGVMSLWAAARPWLLPVVTTAGGLLSGIIVFTFAPEAEGHGTDAAIAAFHQGKPIRARIPLIKLVASAITIGSGGSGGREGPSAQISAGFGSLLGNLLHLNTQDRRIAIATGIGSGIGAIFRAPLGGAVLAAEILYKHDLEVEAIIPALIASIIGYSVFGAWFGWDPIFIVHGSLAFTSPPQLLYYVVLGLLCGLIGWLYARGFYGLTHVFHRLGLPKWVKPGIGGLLVGLIGLAVPQALGMGYGWVQVSMDRSGLLSLPLWVILLLPFAKILATGLSIGSGGSGGIFGPGMVIGASVGATVWRLSYHVLPGVPATPAPFVIVGMMALFGGIAHAPLAVMLMVAEMTGNLSMLAPAMIAVGISSIVVGDATIYTSQVNTRADSPAHRLQLSFPLLSTLAVRQAMTPPPLSFSPRETVAEAEKMLTARTIAGASVLDARGNLLGVLTLADIGRVPVSERSQRRVEEAMNRAVLVAHPDDTLDVTLEQLTSHRIGWMPVVEVNTATGGRHLVGRISALDIMRAYRETLAKGSRRMRGLVEGTVMVEVEIEPGMRLADRPLREAKLPTESLVVSIRRQNELLFPRGSTIIKAGDIVTFLVSPTGEERLRAYLAERVEAPELLLSERPAKS